MVPLIAASKEQVDIDTSLANSDFVTRSKALITKCLNRITTEKEISGSHVSHFLLGNLDKKTSHCFTRLNLHSALGWLADAIRRFYDSDNENGENDDETENIDGSSNDNDNNNTYNISFGNTGFVFVNQMTDYINRGDALSEMCFYEYCSKVYKTTYTEEEKEKLLKRNADPKHARGPKAKRYHFSDDHPQSETHWQVVRKEAQVPSLSKLPPNNQYNKEKFQKCILLLFKPFHVLADLFNGTSWDESYETTDFADNSKYVENIKEMHIGLQERDDARDDDEDENLVNEDDALDDVDEQLENNPNVLREVEIDSQTLEAVDIVKQTGWLDESTSTQSNMLPTFDPIHPVPSINQWKKDI